MTVANIDGDALDVNGNIVDSVVGIFSGKLRVVMTDTFHDGDPWSVDGPTFGGTYASGQPLASGSGLVSS